uniref:carnosine N-methyltransferase n=1 Tax=Emiliania huxleyi TaxID=2903 RepID=A0A7S3TUG8_EMIHU
MQLLRSVRPPLATRLALQHAALLGGMSHEFAALDEPELQQSLPRHCATMKTYQAELLACGAANSAALATVFGRAENHGADRLRSVVWPWLEPLAGTAEDEYEHLGSVWRHMARDWTAGGAAQTGHLRAEVLRLLRGEGLASGAGVPPGGEVLVLGCGQARLAWTIASGLPGARVTGLEASEAQLSAANFFLQCAEEERLAFHPFLDEPRSNLHAAARTAALAAPDIAPAALPRVSLELRRGDFLQLSPSGEEALRGSDAVVTSFFLDCVPAVADSLRSIHALLRPGGLWVFAGPLAYHCWPQLCPTLDQLVGLASEVGLTPLGEPRLLPAGYVQRPGGFGAHEHAWTAAVLVCRRGE